MATDKGKAIRCLIDVADLPPSAFALDGDGRQGKHLQRQRKALAILLARTANADGTSIFPSVPTLAEKMGCHRATIFRLMADLEKLKLITNGGLHKFYKTRERVMHVSALAPVASSEVAPVASSLAPVASSPLPVASSLAPVASSPSPVAKEDATQPPLLTANINRQELTVLPTVQSAPPKNGGDTKSEGGKEGDPFGVDDETPTPMAESEFQKFLSEINDTPELRGAVMTKAEEKMYRTWLQEHPGELPALLAAMGDWIEDREAQKQPINGPHGKYKDKFAAFFKEGAWRIEEKREEVRAQLLKEARWKSEKEKLFQILNAHPRRPEFIAWLKTPWPYGWEQLAKGEQHFKALNAATALDYLSQWERAR